MFRTIKLQYFPYCLISPRRALPISPMSGSWMLYSQGVTDDFSSHNFWAIETLKGSCFPRERSHVAICDATHSTGYFKPPANSVSGLSFYITPIKWDSAEFATLFSATLLRVHSWCSLRAGRMQEEAMAPSWAGGTRASVLAAAPVLGAALWWGAESSPSSSPCLERQPRDHCSLSWPGLLRGLLGLGNMRVGEEGERRDHVDFLTWQVILSSPLRQQYSVLLIQLKSLKQTPAPVLLT